MNIDEKMKEFKEKFKDFMGYENIGQTYTKMESFLRQALEEQAETFDLSEGIEHVSMDWHNTVLDEQKRILNKAHKLAITEARIEELELMKSESLIKGGMVYSERIAQLKKENPMPNPKPSDVREELINTIWDIMYNKKKYVISRHDPALDAIADYIFSPPCLKLLSGLFEIQEEYKTCKNPGCECGGDALWPHSIIVAKERG